MKRRSLLISAEKRGGNGAQNLLRQHASGLEPGFAVQYPGFMVYAIALGKTSGVAPTRP
jgi:hypothetical protein